MKAPPMKWIIARGGYLDPWTDGKTRQSEILWYPILGLVAETLENGGDGVAAAAADDDDDDDKDLGDECAEENDNRDDDDDDDDDDGVAVKEAGGTRLSLRLGFHEFARDGFGH
jgi:hypothetical protein